MKINEFASMGGTSSGAIATVASPLMKKPIKRVQEDTYDYGEPRYDDHVTFNDEGAAHGRVVKNNKDGSYNIRWTETKTVKAHTPAEFTIIHRDKKNESLENTILRR